MNVIDPSRYHYELPEELIAREPAEPRDASRLFVYDTRTDTVTFDTFANVGKYLPENAMLVFNTTKVLPARVKLLKMSGAHGEPVKNATKPGEVEVLFLVNEYTLGAPTIRGMVDRNVHEGQVLAFQNDGSATQYTVTARGHEEHIFSFDINFDPTMLHELLFIHGTTPVPKYIGAQRHSESELRQKYQSIFAETPASIAAPTASLHFTDNVMKSLDEKGISKEFVTLHVGLGTFAPLGEENFISGKLHAEYYDVGETALKHIRTAHKAERPIIPVGTTALRVLETVGMTAAAGRAHGSTDIFIRPPHTFTLASGMITNFHLPNTSLMYLVDALLESKGAKRRILDLYKIALDEKFRFYSFGDAMLVL